MARDPPDGDGSTAADGSHEALRRHLERALDRAEADETRYHLREALQLLAASRDDAE